MKSEPIISIVVPTHNREEQLACCLKSLARLDYPRDRLEVIVVNDGGRHLSASTFGPEQAPDLKLLDQDHAGAAAARNTGAAHAKGEFLAFTDDDCMPDPNWLTALAKRLSAQPDRLVGGRTLNALPQNVFSSASQLLATYLYSYYNCDPADSRFFTSNNMALSKDRFHDIGGFDSSFTRTAGEDRDLCDRWRYHGHRLTYAPEALVCHAHDLTLRTFWRQHFTYGRGAYQFHQARSHRDQTPIRLEPPSFYTDMLRCALVNPKNHRPVTLAALLVLSQAANAAGFVREWLRQRRTREAPT